MGVGEVGGGEKGREKGQQLNLRNMVSSNSSLITTFCVDAGDSDS